MISYEEALLRIENAVRPMDSERIGLENCLGRILADDVFSDIDMPPFDKSAVDGYACRLEDLNALLRILEVIPAGKIPQHSIGKGECSKLMTGGMVPPGADCVIMVEDVEVVDTDNIRYTGTKTAKNICFRAEDLKNGQKVLEKGTIVRPQEIAILASIGAFRPLVFQQFRIGIITTGDELVEPDTIPGPSQIRNSNAWQLLGQCRKAGAVPSYYGITPDNEKMTSDLIEKAAQQNHIVILTGGVSVGDFDFVPLVIENLGFSIEFRSLAVQPGKPTLFAKRDQTYLFGLPGNPVSSFMQFELLVKHLIFKASGVQRPFRSVRLPLGFEYRRRRTDRKSFVPVVLLSEGTIGQVDYHGSAHIHSFTHADGILTVEIGISELKKDSLQDVRLL